MGSWKHFLFFILFTTQLHASGSTSVDPNLIVDKEEFLEFLSNPELKGYFFPTCSRPGRCPFKSYSHNALVLQLVDLAQALRNTRCDSKANDIAGSLNHMAGVLRNSLIINHGIQYGGLIYSVPDITQTNQAAAAKPAPQEARRLPTYDEDADEYTMYLENSQLQGKELLRQLTAAISDSTCVEDIHNAGLVSTIADIAVNIGQMALFVPGQNGLAIGFGTLGFAATLKVLSVLLKSSYDWGREKDRMHFLSLNCNFFDLRKGLEEADFFDSRSEDKLLKAQLGKEYVEYFDIKLTELHKARDAFGKSVVEAQDNFFGPKIGMKKIELFRLVIQIEKLLSMNLEQRPEHRYTLTKDLSSISKKIIPLIASEIKESYAVYLTKLLKAFSDSTAKMDKMTLEKMHAEHLMPLKVHLKHLHEDMEAIVRPHLHDYDKQMVSETENNRQAIERGERIYSELHKEIMDKKAQLMRRISLYEERTRKNLFGSYENGAHMDFDVLKEYDDSKQLILGHRGWGFLKFLMRTANQDIKNFNENYEKWSEKYLEKDMKSEKMQAEDVVWSCRDAHHMRVKWNTAFSALGMANDFYETNKGILSTDYPNLQYIFRYVPISRSEELKIYKNMRALEMARSIVRGRTDYKKSDVHKAYRGAGPNLGELILSLDKSEKKRNDVDAFFMSHNCHLHL